MKINRVAKIASRTYDIACYISIAIFGPLIFFTIGLGIWDRLR